MSTEHFNNFPRKLRKILKDSRKMQDEWYIRWLHSLALSSATMEKFIFFRFLIFSFSLFLSEVTRYFFIYLLLSFFRLWVEMVESIVLKFFPKLKWVWFYSHQWLISNDMNWWNNFIFKNHQQAELFIHGWTQSKRR